MSVPIAQPTPYQDVNATLDLLLSSMQAVLGDRLVGLYLGGSLALGDFDPGRSDIDFVAVTADELPPEMVAALREMHARLWDTGSKWAMKLDGSYVPQQVIRRWTSDHAPCPFVEGDRFEATVQGSAVIQRHIIREHGVVIAGPDPHTLIDPVDADGLRDAMREMLEKWWRPLLDDPDWLQTSQNQPFAILTMCRTLYTLEHGVVASKPVTAQWAQGALGEQWAALIEWALAWSPDTESNQLTSTLKLIQYTLKRYAQYEDSERNASR